MTPEEYERIKEAEKEHLRKLKQLKQQVRDLERKKKVADALDDMVKAPGEDILGTHEEMMGKLQEETALREARLEIALEEQGLDAATPAEPAGPSEEELQKARAEALVKQMKTQMGQATEPPAKKQDPASDVAPEATDEAPTEDSLPEKTIGRIRKKP